MTPRVYVMMDGPAENDPESGQFFIPRIRDPRFVRTAALVALQEEAFVLLTDPDPVSGRSVLQEIDVQLYGSREEAFLAHPEFEWDRLGKFSGIDF